MKALFTLLRVNFSPLNGSDQPHSDAWWRSPAVVGYTLARQLRAHCLPADDVQNVPVRVFKPRHLHAPARMDVAVAFHAGHVVVVLELHAFGFKHPNNGFQFISHNPAQSGSVIGAGVL